MISITAAIFCLFSFALGYICGRVDLLLGSIAQLTTPRPQSFFTKAQREDKTLVNKQTAVPDIDTSVYVGTVSTSGLSKTSESSIGKTSVTEDNINQSVSKLLQLKGK